MTLANKEVYVSLMMSWSEFTGASTLAEQALTRLIKQYDQEKRHARDAWYLATVMRELDYELQWPDGLMKGPPEVVYAAAFYAWFHYDVRDLHGSLDKSAAVAFEELELIGFDSGFCGAVGDVICELKLDKPSCRQGQHLQDAAMGIFSEGTPAYDMFVLGLRREYEHWSDTEWVQNRKAWLEAMLGKTHIYNLTSNLSYDDTARYNIRRELDMLNAGMLPGLAPVK